MEGAVACQFLFPTEVDSLALDESAWESIQEVIGTKAYLRSVTSISEFASCAKLLYPEKTEFICTRKIFFEVKAEVEFELGRLSQEETSKDKGNFLSVAFGAMVLFPDRLAELGLKSEAVLDLLASKVPSMHLENHPDELFKMKMVFPGAVPALNINQVLESSQKRILEEIRKHRPGLSRFSDELHLKNLLGLQLLADDARIDSNGLIVIPSKVRLEPAPKLPDRSGF